jgi:hypothetical protein
MKRASIAMGKVNLRMVGSRSETHCSLKPNTELRDRHTAWKNAAYARGISLEQARQERREELDAKCRLLDDPGFMAYLVELNSAAEEAGLSLREAVNEMKLAHSLAGCPWPEK